ncbi:MAG: PhoH family protein [Gemmatimonadota bacterium]
MHARTTAHLHAIPLDGVDQLTLFGTNDRNLKLIERLSDARLFVREGELRIQGPPEIVSRVSSLVEHLMTLIQTGVGFDPDDVRRFYDELSTGTDTALERLDRDRVAIRGTQKIIKPKTAGQEAYLGAMTDNDITVSIGPAGTGKTYLAVAMAIDALHRKTVRRIVLARPAVEAGETLGFLPGDLQEKVDPYLRPLYDALEDMLAQDRVRRYLETRTIEIAPLAYMRGRTLADAYVILDEAQNATTRQMKMFLTRLGLNSRAVITGDKTQIDLPPREESGLLQIERILKGIDGIAFVYLTARDVIRHALVQKILKAYETSEDTGDRSSRASKPRSPRSDS